MAPPIANARVYVPRPGIITQRPFGLFSAANGPLDIPVHARQGGLEFQTVTCDLPTCFDSFCAAVDATDKTFTSGGPSLITGDPFVVRSDLECAPVGLTDAQLRMWLLERLRAGEQSVVERTFSMGFCAAAPSLSNNTPAATNAGPSATIVEAVGELEAALYAVYGQLGVIHAPFLAANYMKATHLIERDGPVWRTAAGTVVSIGNYAGEGPAGEDPAAGTQNLYITGQVTVWRTPDSDVFATTMADALQRVPDGDPAINGNQVFGQAEREYVVAFECAAFYTLTTLAGF